MYLIIDGIVATIPAQAYIIGIKVLGLFFLSHIKEPKAASDILKTWNSARIRTQLAHQIGNSRFHQIFRRNNIFMFELTFDR